MKLRLLFLAVLVANNLGCRDLTRPDTTAGKLVRCGTEAVQRNWPKVLPSVNTCLTDDQGAYEPCLLGLINPAVGITEDVVACVLRDQGQKFAASVEANAGDARAARAAVRAQTFINKQRYQFAE